MRRFRSLSVTFLLSTVLLAVQTPALVRELSFSERVAAQEAIERTRYVNQIGATEPFEEAVPREVLASKVRTYLAQSAALERMWHTPVTGEMLQRELQRMTVGSRMPERLQELFSALGDDPVLIQECLVRPVLVQRLTRNFFAFDAGIHAEARQEAETLREGLASGRIDPRTDHPARRVAVIVRRDEPVREVNEHRDEIELAPAEFDRLRGLAPQRVGAIGVLSDERASYALRVVLEEQADRATIATYLFPKRTWDAWWSEARSELDPAAVATVASDEVELPRLSALGGGDCRPDVWENGILDDLPPRRAWHSAVWTGSEMIVWGGATGNWSTHDGMRYDPATDSWKPTSDVGAPSGRSGHHAVWTGEEMIVWGGGYLASTGGRYDPINDTWLPTSTNGAPAGRWGSSAVWTGEAMIIWGGNSEGGVVFNDGARYYPLYDTWVPTPTIGAPPPRSSHSAVWTGDRMIVWGGYDGSFSAMGWSYDPAGNSWSMINNFSAPSGRTGHSAVWTGSEMIVWGGSSSSYFNDGARYNPATDSWTPMSTTLAPAGRTNHTAVWTGDRMIVWGGEYGWLNTGGVYDPATNSWFPTTMIGAPEGRSNHTAVWADDRMIVWGGDTYNDPSYRRFATGGRYDPVSNSWTPTYAPGAPEGRRLRSTVWTGNEMIVWGGGFETGGDGIYIEALDNGGRYSPVTDSWIPTSMLNAPDPRYGHTAVWSGTYMIVWGGTNYFDEYATGGRYEPISNTWGGMSTAGAPSARAGHAALWTGSEMIVWGGGRSGSTGQTGARYEPVSDVWIPVSGVGAPSSRSSHTAVWTGEHMVVWGGYWQGDRTHTGARYDPDDDSWSPTSIAGAPSARSLHTATWNGSTMIVWGGNTASFSYTNTGGRYDPATDSWTPTATVDAPEARTLHTAVWSDHRMIVWGGDNWGAFDDGARYDPIADVWVPTSRNNAPSARAYHSAVSTGDRMIVWGGAGPLSDGGNYSPNGFDRDGDGHGCGIDCDDTDPGAFAVPNEVESLRFGTNHESLQWISAAPLSGNGTVYDIVRGVVSELPVGSGSSETCVEPDYDPGPGASGVIEWDAPAIPASGTAFWYLVRAGNSCGQGGYGFRSNGAPRVTSACP